ncbi:MAG: ceramidase domain-containing protein [Herpetosiphonaceae bacterium]|nr:ceramidase domain-containing protein [Herpetosiphonaceae bacterium]
MRDVWRWTRLPLLGFGVIGVAMAWLSSVRYDWAGWAPASCLPERCFCEALRPAVFRQPANTWSSLGFVLAGLLVFGLAARDRATLGRVAPANLLAAQPAYSLLYGLALLIIGAGSAFYHASLSLPGQFIDVFGMNLIATFVLVYARARSGGDPRRLVWLYILLNLALAGLLLAIPALRRYAFAVVLLLGVGLELRTVRRHQLRIQTRLIKQGLLLMALAFAIWLLDLSKTVCAAASLVQGHAIWHLLGAVAALWLYRYYRSERPGTSS